jgi:hypothetical protein
MQSQIKWIYVVIVFDTKQNNNKGKKFWQEIMAFSFHMPWTTEMTTPKMLLLLNAYSLPLERVY